MPLSFSEVLSNWSERALNVPHMDNCFCVLESLLYKPPSPPPQPLRSRVASELHLRGTSTENNAPPFKQESLIFTFPLLHKHFLSLHCQLDVYYLYVNSSQTYLELINMDEYDSSNYAKVEDLGGEDNNEQPLVALSRGKKPGRRRWASVRL